MGTKLNPGLHLQEVMKYSGLAINPAPKLADLTTIRLGGTAIAEVVLEEAHGLEALPEVLHQLGGKAVSFGRGSNIIAGSGELPLVLIRAGLNYSRESEQEEHSEQLEVSASLPLPVLLKRMAERGCGILAGLAGIPGSVGGAVCMNAGSFGSDIGTGLEAIRIYSAASGVIEKKKTELDLGYRHFRIKDMPADEWFIILSASFNIKLEDKLSVDAKKKNILEYMRDCNERKKSAQPVAALSAGCVFKNHVQGPAGKLLDEAGLKGFACGGMSFSQLHANFMINSGKGTPEEAFELIAIATEKVKAHCGANLETEVCIWR